MAEFTLNRGRLPDRDVPGLSWEDKKKVIERIALEAYQRVHCNTAFLIVKQEDPGKATEEKRRK